MKIYTVSRYNTISRIFQSKKMAENHCNVLNEELSRDKEDGKRDSEWPKYYIDEYDVIEPERMCAHCYSDEHVGMDCMSKPVRFRR